MSPNSSFLLSAVGRNLTGNDIDAEGLAKRLGLHFARLTDCGTTISEILDAGSGRQSPTLLVGTGNFYFDADTATALGLPVVLLVDAPGRHVELAHTQAEELRATIAATVTAEELGEADTVRNVVDAVAAAETEQIMSAPVFERRLLDRAQETNSRVVLAEGEDDRILQAAHQLLASDTVALSIIGEPEKITARAAELDLDLSKAELVDHLNSPLIDDFVTEYTKLREHKGMTEDKARETMRDVSYFATMMVHLGHADGMVSGAAHTTAHTIRPSFQIIKTTPETSVVSSIFLMIMRGRSWAFGDCAVNPNPTTEQIGEIAAVSAKTASQFGIDPRVAILSYSTGASGSGPDVEKAVAGLNRARDIDPQLKVDGPLQFDAAVDPGVAAKKMPESDVAGKATVFIFPDLNAGNIGYKTAQRTGGALAVGPILQGLNKPVNDLSRGATVADIVNTVAVTAIQAGGAEK